MQQKYKKKTRKEKKNERRRNPYARVRRYKITSTLGLLVRGDPQNEGLRGLQPRALGSKLDYFHAGITSTRLHRPWPHTDRTPLAVCVLFIRLRECWMWKTPFCVVNSLQSHWRRGKRRTFFVECCQRLGPAAVWVSLLVFTNLAAWSYALFSLRGLEWYFIPHTPITLTDWSCSGSWREWRHVQQTQDDRTFGKAAGAGPEEPWKKKRSPFWHVCNMFLMYSKWQPNYTHCKFGACFHCWTEFAFSWRTEKQRPRLVHAVTIICLHCKYSFELQRSQAEDQHAVYAMTLASAVDDFSWRTDRDGAHSLGPSDSNLHALQVLFGVGEETIERGHGAYMQWPARTFTVDVCFHWRTVKQSSRVIHAVPQQPVDSNLLALQVFFELQRGQAEEQRSYIHGACMQWQQPEL